MYSRKADFWYCKHLWNYKTISMKFQDNIDNENVSCNAVLWRYNKNIQDGGQLPFWITISRWKIVRFWWNFVYYSRYWTRWHSHDQKLKFLKFKVANGRHVANRFLAITERNFVRGSRMACRLRPRDKKNANFENPRWRTATIFNMVIWRTYGEGIYRHNYPLTLKSRLRITQCNWKRKHWIDHTRLTISRVIWRWILSWLWNVD